MDAKTSTDLMRFINTKQENWNNPIIIATQVANFFVSGIDLSNDCIVLKLSLATSEVTEPVQVSIPVAPAAVIPTSIPQPVQRTTTPAKPIAPLQRKNRAGSLAGEVEADNRIKASTEAFRENIDYGSTSSGRPIRPPLELKPIDEETLKRLQPKPFIPPKSVTIKVADESAGSLMM
jgi:hypothetical protein